MRRRGGVHANTPTYVMDRWLLVVVRPGGEKSEVRTVLIIASWSTDYAGWGTVRAHDNASCEAAHGGVSVCQCASARRSVWGGCGYGWLRPSPWASRVFAAIRLQRSVARTYSCSLSTTAVRSYSSTVAVSLTTAATTAELRCPRGLPPPAGARLTAAEAADPAPRRVTGEHSHRARRARPPADARGTPAASTRCRARREGASRRNPFAW